MCTIYKLIQICTPNFLTKELKFVLKKFNSRNNASWQNWTSANRRMKLGPYFSLCTKVNSMWIKCLDLTPEMLRQL